MNKERSENHGKKWLKDDDDLLMNLLKDGKNVESLSFIFQRSKSSILLRIYKNIINLYNNDDEIKKMCDIYELNFDNIIKFRYYQNYKKSDEYKEILKQKRLENKEKKLKKNDENGNDENGNDENVNNYKENNILENINIVKNIDNCDEKKFSVNLSKQQMEVVTSFKNGENIFLSGMAGSGKSTIIKFIIDYCKNQEINYSIIAPTGCAAILVNGITIHSFFGMDFNIEENVKNNQDYLLYINKIKNNVNKLHKKYKKKYNLIKNTDVLIIDEISMVSNVMFENISDMLKIIKKCNKPFGGIQLILSGDFYQLPPINNTFCFKSDEWKICNTKNYILTKNYRQKSDKKFKSILKHLRNDYLTNDDIILLKNCEKNILSNNDVKPTQLHSLNKYVNNVNDKLYKQQLELMTDKFKNTDIIYNKIYKPIYKNNNSKLYASSTNYDVDIELCIGAQIIITYNINVELGLVNGTRGIIKDLYDNYITIIDTFGNTHFIYYYKLNHTLETFNDNGEKIIDKYIEFEFLPVKLAYALSIHKSQGMTLDCAIINFSNIFSTGQAYTALSRVVSLNNLQILNFNPNVFINNKEVLEFYKNII